MNSGMLAVEVEVPVTVTELLPMTPRNIVGILAEKETVDVTAPAVLVTTGVTLLSVKPATPDILPVKTFVASVTPAGIGPSTVIEPAAAKAGDVLAIDATLAASAAACNLLRSCVARL